MTSPTADGQGWRQIDSIPKDGSWFLGVSKEWADGKEAIMLRWNMAGYIVDWDDDSYHHLTCWQPLPPPPTSGESA